MGDRAFRPTTAAHLAEAVYAQGRDEDAGPLTEISEQLAARDDLLTQVVWRRVRAKVMARQGRIDEAEDLAREAVTISESTDFLNTRADALVDLADVHRRAGRLDEARTAAAKGIALYEEKGNRVAAEQDAGEPSGLAANVRRSRRGVGALLELDLHELVRLGRMVARWDPISTRFSSSPAMTSSWRGRSRPTARCVDDVVVRILISHNGIESYATATVLKSAVTTSGTAPDVITRGRFSTTVSVPGSGRGCNSSRDRSFGRRETRRPPDPPTAAIPPRSRRSPGASPRR